jgi:hypothetical protein
MTFVARGRKTNTNQEVVVMGENDRSAVEPLADSAGNTRATRTIPGPTARLFRGPYITLELPVEISATLNKLMSQTHHDAEEVFIKSLFLYEAAVDAEAAGKKMVILDADGDIDQEITGL